MPTRRQTLLGLASLASGSASVVSGAFSGSATTPASNLRVLADARFPAAGLELRPGRDDESHVVTDGVGLVTDIVLTPAGGSGISKGAETRFEDIVEIHKTPPGPPVDEIYFEFEVVDAGLQGSDPTPAEIQAAFFIAAADGDIPGDGSQNYLEATDVGDAHNDLFSPNQHVPFGIGVDLLPPGITDLPDPGRFHVQLNIQAEQVPQGPPGTGGNGPP